MPDDAVVSVNDKLQDAEIRHSVFLERFKSGRTAEITKLFDEETHALQVELAGELSLLEDPPNRFKLASVLAGIAASRKEAVKRINEAIDKMIEEFIIYESGFQLKALDDAIPKKIALAIKLNLKTPSSQQIFSAVYKDPFFIGPDADGALSALSVQQMLKNWSARDIERIRAVTTAGYLNGEPVPEIIRKLTGKVPRGQKMTGAMRKTRAGLDAVLRTAIQRAAMEARKKVGEENSSIIKGVKYEATLDHRTTPICRFLDGKYWDIDDPSIRYPPVHIRCVLGDTLVIPSGMIVGASKRWVKGDIIILQTAGGHELSCTPNHPILMEDGWVGVGKVQLGDKIMCSPNIAGSVNISELVDHFFNHPMVKVYEHKDVHPGSYHGDGGLSNKALVGSLDDWRVHYSKPPDDEVVTSILHGYHYYDYDEVQNIIRRSFEGFVYNIETTDHYYIANGVIVKNCRSAYTYVSKSWRELGIDRDEIPAGTRASMNGQVPADLTYSQWFDQQVKKPGGAQLIQDVLGPTRGKLYKQGNLRLDRFVDNDGDLINLKQLRRLEPDAFTAAGLGKVA